MRRVYVSRGEFDEVCIDEDNPQGDYGQTRDELLEDGVHIKNAPADLEGRRQALAEQWTALLEEYWSLPDAEDWT